MKQIIFKYRIAAIILSLSGLMITATVPSFANNKNKALAAASATISPSVNYIGSDENGAGFLVKVEAAAPVKFELSIIDKSGFTIYSKVYEGASFSKTFRLVNEETISSGISFTIKTLPGDSVHTFNVSSSEKMVTAIAIKKS